MFSDPYPTRMSPTKLTVRENLTTFACWLGHGRHTDKENQGKKYKKYCFSLKQQESTSLASSRKRICTKVKSLIRIHIKVIGRVRIKIGWIRNTGFDICSAVHCRVYLVFLGMGLVYLFQLSENTYRVSIFCGRLWSILNFIIIDFYFYYYTLFLFLAR